jgi:hypothetical protein
VAAAGYDPSGFSGHSLRAGLATSAVQAGVSTLKDQKSNRPRERRDARAVLRDGELFVDNAAGALL